MENQKFDLSKLDESEDAESNIEFTEILKNAIAAGNAEKWAKGIPIACYVDRQAFLLWPDGHREFID